MVVLAAAPMVNVSRKEATLAVAPPHEATNGLTPTKPTETATLGGYMEALCRDLATREPALAQIREFAVDLAAA